MVALESESDVLDHGDRAPSFELKGTDGKRYALEDFDDYDALLVVFTCNHCPYAKAKYEAMNQIAADFDDVAVVGINPNDADEYPEDSFEKMIEYVERGDIDITAYLRDETQAVAESYGAVCTPDPFLFENSEARSASGQASGGEPRAAFRLVYHGRFDDATNPDEEPSGEPGEEIRSAIDAVLHGETPEPERGPSRGCSIKWREE